MWQPLAAYVCSGPIGCGTVELRLPDAGPPPECPWPHVIPVGANGADRMYWERVGEIHAATEAQS